MNELYTRHNYLNTNTTYLKNVKIREYDMRDGGFSLIKHNKLLDKETIDMLSRLPKMKRHYMIGDMQRENTDLAKKMLEGFKESRRILFEENDIENSQILSIKKDAVFTIDKSLNYLELNEHVKFVLKHTYSSYLFLNGIEFYYNYRDNSIDVKGIKSHNDDGIILEVKRIMRLLENTTKPESLFNIVRKLKIDYVNRDLDIECYRELNPNRLFKFNKQFIKTSLYFDKVSEDNLDNIDITYNFANVIIPLINLIV